MNILYMAEKANAGTDIAKALGITGKNEDGFYEDVMPGKRIVIGWVSGHYVTLKEPAEIDEKYKKWKLEDLPLPMDMNNSLKIIKGKESAFNKLKSYIKEADIIVNAGDAGREGELIQRWVLKLSGGASKPVKRLWASSLTKDAIIKANNTLHESNEFDNLYEAGEARAFMDAMLGFNYSRALSLSKTDGITVSYGRCQTPLLNAICERDREIESFKKVPFSYIAATTNNEKETATVLIDARSGKRKEYSSHTDADVEKQQVKSLIGTVKSSEHIKKIETAPKPFDLLNLQKEMAKKYSFDADYTLDICQKLYDTYKILSYPRTDGKYLTTDLKGEVRKHLDNLSFEHFKSWVVKASMSEIPDRYYNDSKITDHHALIPVINTEMESMYNKLSDDEKRVFDAVVKRFIALFYPVHEYENINTIIDIDGFSFLLKEEHDLTLGFQGIYNTEKKEAMNYKCGDKIAFDEIAVIDDVTKPRKRFTTDTLLTLMEMYGIGTGATRAAIIKELVNPKGINKECYVEKKNSAYISTRLGRDIIGIIPEELKKLEILSDYDSKLRDIEDGKLNKSAFLQVLQEDIKNHIQILKSCSETKIYSDQPKRKMTDYICPLCGKALVEHTSGFGCSGYYDKSCTFFLSSTKGGKKIPKKELENLLKNGKTGIIKGFKSKNGKSFDTGLILENGKIIYEFQVKNS